MPRSWYFSRTITTISLWLWFRIDISCSAFVRRWLSGHNRRIQEKSSFQLNSLLNSLLSLKTLKKICFSFLYDLVITWHPLWGNQVLGAWLDKPKKVFRVLEIRWWWPTQLILTLPLKLWAVFKLFPIVHYFLALLRVILPRTFGSVRLINQIIDLKFSYVIPPQLASRLLKY